MDAQGGATMGYEELIEEAEQYGIITKEKPLRAYDGRIKGNRIYIRQNMTTVQKACVLAEELGHYHTTQGDIIDQTVSGNRKQESRARLYAYRKMVTVDKLISAKRAGCRNRFEIADHIGTTEEMLQAAVNRYKEIYGTYLCRDGFLIRFDPLNIYEII